MPLRSARSLFLVLGVACSGTTPSAKETPIPARAAEPAENALSGLAAQHIVVLPLYSIRVMPGLAWGSAIGRPSDFQRTVDAEILSALEEKGLRRTWIFPDQLEQSYHRNSTYATDPYGLAEEPLRSPSLALDARLPDPLASQLRTVIALHEDARYVLAPVEMRFEKAGNGGQAVLRLVLIDPRFSSVRWIGDIVSDTAPAFGPALAASIATRLANAISNR
jgi:hypothetical protein